MKLPKFLQSIKRWFENSGFVFEKDVAIPIEPYQVIEPAEPLWIVFREVPDLAACQSFGARDFLALKSFRDGIESIARIAQRVARDQMFEVRHIEIIPSSFEEGVQDFGPYTRVRCHVRVYVETTPSYRGTLEDLRRAMEGSAPSLINNPIERTELRFFLSVGLA